MKLVEDKTSGKSSSLGSLDQSRDISNINRFSESNLRLRLREMIELNIQLENLVAQRTQKLEEVVETNTKFISIIAHDLRSPFTAILGALELLKGSLGHYDINEFGSYINMASESANSTLSLLDNLLAWTISQNRQKNFTPVKINLRELITAEVNNIKASAAQKQILLNHSTSPELNVTADLQMARTIVRNLLSNAIKYTNSGGEISLRASRSDQFVEIRVKDNGIGISAEAQKTLFKIEAFHSTAGTRKEKGTGLGLLLCKEFVEIHGGTILVKSEPGKGCEIKFTLPHYL